MAWTRVGPCNKAALQPLSLLSRPQSCRLTGVQKVERLHWPQRLSVSWRAGAKGSAEAFQDLEEDDEDLEIEEEDEDDFGEPSDDEESFEFNVNDDRGGSRSYGPPLPPDDGDLSTAYDIAEDGKPMWLKDLEADIENDPEVRELLEGTDGDPEKVRRKMAKQLEKRESFGNDMYEARLGVDKPMRVTFRSLDPMTAYFWLELYQTPSPKHVDLVGEAIRSWFMLGKLGAYNGMNLQVHMASEEDLSYMPYRQDQDDEALSAFYHELSEIETNGKWIRFKADLGTGDDVGIDILINTLQGFSREYLGIKQLCIGGVNEDWPTPEGSDEPGISMNPIRTDVGDDAWDDMENLDVEGIMNNLQRDQDAEMFEKSRARKTRLEDLDLGE